MTACSVDWQPTYLGIQVRWTRATSEGIRSGVMEFPSLLPESRHHDHAATAKRFPENCNTPTHPHLIGHNCLLSHTQRKVIGSIPAAGNDLFAFLIPDLVRISFLPLDNHLLANQLYLHSSPLHPVRHPPGILRLLSEPFVVQKLLGCRSVPRIQLHHLQNELAVRLGYLMSSYIGKSPRQRFQLVKDPRRIPCIVVGNLVERGRLRAEESVHATQCI